jgi:hypothetical protein
VNPDETVNNLEHILPKEPDLSVWNNFTEESAQVFLFRLGNQTLLSKEENEKLGNAGFEVKRNVFAKSPVLVTQNAGAVAEWNDEAIEAQQSWMSDVAPDAWPIKG